MRWRRRRQPVATVEQVAAAEREVELSRHRLRETHERVVKPLDRYATGNNFAQIIADGLAVGRSKERD